MTQWANVWIEFQTALILIIFEPAMDKAQEAANLIWHAMQSRHTTDPVRSLIGDSDIELAYEVQRLVHANRYALGHKKIGCKIGLTSFAVQKQLGVDQPDYGILFDDMQIEDQAVLPYSELIQPKAEAEIAFILGRDITSAVDEESMSAAISHARAAIEIVGSRVINWDIRITDTVADNASASHFVLGTTQRKIGEFDLVNCRMELWLNGELRSEGLGSACLGSPLRAAVWLANTMLRLREPLRKGDIILSGALGPMVNLSQGDVVKARVEGLGAVGFQTV
jgi:2-keto-4-pentenoate hydratase